MMHYSNKSVEPHLNTTNQLGKSKHKYLKRCLDNKMADTTTHIANCWPSMDLQQNTNWYSVLKILAAQNSWN